MKTLYDNKYFIYDKPIRLTFKYIVKRFLYPFLNIFYKLVFAFIPKDTRICKYETAICTIFKNEAPYMKEWIEYHLIMGIDHFFLYNNNSTDNYFEILQPYIDKGIVTFTEWQINQGQAPMYKDWYNNFRNEVKWVCFIDLDEFICPRDKTNFKDWLSDYSRYPAIIMYWKFFGTSGRISHDSTKLVIEQYVHCYEKFKDIGKVVYNTRFEIDNFSSSMSHFLFVKWKGLFLPSINDSKQSVLWNGVCRVRPSKTFSIQLNHYWSKSFESFENKKARGSAAHEYNWKTLEIFQQFEHENKSTDSIIYRFLIDLKLAMRK
jgi:hypothetical protein